MQAQLIGLSADRLMDSLVGVSGFVSGMTANEFDDLWNNGVVACRNDAEFMALLRKIIDRPAAQAAPQAIDLATIMKIVAAIKMLIDLFNQLKGGGGGGLLPGLPQGYAPNQANRCI